MFKKMRLNGEIKKLRQQIVDLENKRSRSQSALVSAILAQKSPEEADVEFFNTYTKQIDEVREVLKEKEDELAKMN